nr:MAG TPA: hypothetical protein [Caudoviricetes sp.]
MAKAAAAASRSRFKLSYHCLEASKLFFLV